MSTEQLQKRLLIGNKRGLHARAAAKFVTLAAEFEADIEVEAKRPIGLGSFHYGVDDAGREPGHGNTGACRRR